MGRPSPLVVRWKKAKAKARRAGYWGRGLMKTPAGTDTFAMSTDTLAYNKHASSSRHADLCRLFDLQYQEPRYDYQVKQRNRAAWELFNKPIPLADMGVEDAKLAVEDRAQMLWLLDHDPQYRFLKFSYFYKIGDYNSPVNLSVHFQGTEYFLIERVNNRLRRSTIYSSKERMLMQYDQRRIIWAKTLLIEDS